MQPLAAVDRVGQCGSCGAPLRAEEVALHRIDPHSDAADELLCAACAPAPPGPFPPGTGPAALPALAAASDEDFTPALLSRSRTRDRVKRLTGSSRAARAQGPRASLLQLGLDNVRVSASWAPTAGTAAVEAGGAGGEVAEDEAEGGEAGEKPVEWNPRGEGAAEAGSTLLASLSLGRESPVGQMASALGWGSVDSLWESGEMPAAAAMLLEGATSDSEPDEPPAGDLPGLCIPAAEPAAEGRQAGAALLESVGSVDAPGPAGGAAAHEAAGGPGGLGAFCAALLANANLSQSAAPLPAGARQTAAPAAGLDAGLFDIEAPAGGRGADGLTALALTWNLHGAVPAESLQPLLRPGAYDVYAVGSQVGPGRIVRPHSRLKPDSLECL
jgi:hypothetical protein